MTQTLTKLYDLDFADWIDHTVARLKARDFAGVDWENLIEEIESLGRSERHGIKSQWIRVVLHLLKLEAQPQARDYHNSWVSSVLDGLEEISDFLQASPSLKPYLQAHESAWYHQALRKAVIETRLPLTHFPQSCPYDVFQLIAGHYPESLRYFFIIE